MRNEFKFYPDAHITHQGFSFRGFVSLLVDDCQLRTDFFVNHVAVFVSILRGQDVDGNPVTKSYVYSNVKPDVEPKKLLAVGKALGGLSEMAGRSFYIFLL